MLTNWELTRENEGLYISNIGLNDVVFSRELFRIDNFLVGYNWCHLFVLFYRQRINHVTGRFNTVCLY